MSTKKDGEAVGVEPLVSCDEHIGDWIDERCPECRSQLIENKRGTKWCVECTWSNNQELTDFMKGLSS